MNNKIKYATVLSTILFASACAGGTGDSGGPDWSKSETYNVKTGRGDRVLMEVVGNATEGYDYNARIRHTSRSDPDPLDRQRVLGDASRIIVARICGIGAKETQPSYASNYYERRGRFVCDK